MITTAKPVSGNRLIIYMVVVLIIAAAAFVFVAVRLQASRAILVPDAELRARASFQANWAALNHAGKAGNMSLIPNTGVQLGMSQRAVSSYGARMSALAEMKGSQLARAQSAYSGRLNAQAGARMAMGSGMDAYAARLNALAKPESSMGQRAASSYSARLKAVAAQWSGAPAPGLQAYSARLSALAGLRPESAQRAQDAYAARMKAAAMSYLAQDGK